MSVLGVSHKIISMTEENFYSSLERERPPENFSPLLRALWYDKKGDWITAHQIVQVLHSPRASRVHAYLHRKNGETDNATYWYQKARQPFPSLTPDKEWEILLRTIL